MRKAGKWLGTYKWPGAHLVWTKINLADVAARHSPQRNERSAPPTLRRPLAHRALTGALCGIGLGARLVLASPRASIF